MKWQLQLARSAVKRALPFKPTLRRLKRSISSYPPDISNLDTTLEDAFTLIRVLRGTGRTVKDRTVLEIGSGWFPVIPIIYAVLGARRVILTDLQRYMDDGTFRAARDYLMMNAPRVAENLEISPARIAAILNGSTTQADLAFDYIVPFDPGRLELLDLVDVISSRAVLEHVPQADLCALLPLWARLLSHEGVMMHAIDMSDHFEHGDKSISRINYLRFSRVSWRLINAVGDHQNRLRHSDFMAMFAAAGLHVLALETRTDPQALDDAAQLELASPFNRMAPDDIAILTSYVILEPAQR